MMDHKSLAEQMVKLSLDKGADAAEAYIEAGRELNIEVRDGKIETVQESSSRGAGLRVFMNGRMAFASSNDFMESAVEDTVSSAVRMARVTSADENNVLPDDRELSEIEGLYDPELSKVDMDKKIAVAMEAERLAMKDRRISKSAGSGYNEGESEIFIANSSGLSKNMKTSFCVYYVSVVAEKGEQKSTGSESCSRRFFGDLMNPQIIAEKAAKDAYSMIDPRMVKTQRAAVIFDPDAAGSVLGGILAAVNGERVLQGASFLMNKMDQRIAPESVTLIDDGTRPRGLASRPFDGEGVPTQKRVIVDRGILKGFMYNTRAASRAGVKSTGNASRRGFTSLPGIGSHQFYMEKGETDPRDIINETGRGLYLKGVTGYGINPVNGDFSGGAEGFWIENGRISFPVKGLTIAGTAFEMLSGIDSIGRDLDLNRNFTAPTFRVREMQIGGE